MRYTKKQLAMIDHNEDIINDNIFFGLNNPTDYSKSDVNKYRKESKKKQKELKEFLLKGGAPVFDNETQMYVIPE